MTYFKKNLFTFIFCFYICCFHKGFSQENHNYTLGKKYFDSENYPASFDIFQKIIKENNNQITKQDSVILPYCYFYSALSSFQIQRKYKGTDKIQKKYQSIEYLFEILKQFPSWDKKEEIYYWLGYFYFENKQYVLGIPFLERIQDTLLQEDVKKLKKKYFINENVENLKKIYQEYPKDTLIAKGLYAKLNLKDTLRISIEKKFNVAQNQSSFRKENNLKKKENFHISVLLPFLFNGLEDETHSINNVAYSLYCGISLAKETLAKENKKIQVHFYDTKKANDNNPIKNILSTHDIEKSNVLIGPLYLEHYKIVSEYTLAKEKILVNPLSTNAEITQNPYSYLIKSSGVTQSIKTAHYVADYLHKPKTALIFYEENSKDSLVANTYKNILLTKNFNIINTMGLNPNNGKFFSNYLTKKIEIVIEAKTEEEAKEHKEKNPKAIIKNRKKKFFTDSLEWYEEVWNIKMDSIGHIFLASSNPLLVSHLISAIAIRYDSITIVGREEWLESSQVNIEQIEKLKVLFISNGYIDEIKPQYLNFRTEYINTYRTIPSPAAAYGYETMMIFGRMLYKYGNNIQEGITKEKEWKGELIDCYLFDNQRDNQKVTLLQIKNGHLTKINN